MRAATYKLQSGMMIEDKTKEENNIFSFILISFGYIDTCHTVIVVNSEQNKK